MSEELKLCPFCGRKAIREEICDNDIICCSGGEDCITGSIGKTPGKWNTRPIEDALQKQITALKTALEFYAGAGNYKHTPGGFGFQGMKSPAVINDNGEIARAALDGWNSGEIRELEDGEK